MLKRKFQLLSTDFLLQLKDMRAKNILKSKYVKSA